MMLEPRRVSFANYAVVATLLAATLTHLFLVAVGNPPFSPDSWTYLELSKTIDREFYRFSTWRSFWEHEPLSTAMPPLWPGILWIVNKTADLGIYAGFMANFAIFATFAAVTEASIRKSNVPSGTGVLSAFLLLTYPPFVDEMISGRAIPLSLLIMTTQVWVLVAGRDRPWHALLFGLLLGLATLNRFDFLPIGIGGVLLAGLLWRSWRFAAMAGMILALTVSPWIAYSITGFGKFFATDNAIVATSVDPQTFVTDYYRVLPKTLFQEPVLWIDKVLGNASSILTTILTAWPQMILTYVLVFWTASVLVMMKKPARQTGAVLFGAQIPWSPRFLIFVFGFVSLLPVAGYLATGYSDLRYFSPQVWLTGLFCLLFLTSRDMSRQQGQVAFSTLLVAATLLANLQYWRAPITWPPQLTARQTSLSAVQPIIQCLDLAHANSSATTLFIGDSTEAAKFGALTDRMTSMLPENWPRLTLQERAVFFADFKIKFVYFTPRNTDANAVDRSYLQSIDRCEIEFFRLVLPND